MTDRITLANAQSFIRQMKADWEAEHKYQILGKVDLTFQNTAKAINNDATFDAFRRARIDGAIHIAQINASSADGDTKAKQIAQAKIGFLQKALTELRAVAQKGDAKAIVRAVNSLSTELSGAVTAYTGDMANSPNAVSDPKFIATANAIADGFRSLLTAETPRLAKAQELYSVDSVKALKALATVKAALLAAANPV